MLVFIFYALAAWLSENTHLNSLHSTEQPKDKPSSKSYVTEAIGAWLWVKTFLNMIAISVSNKRALWSK